MQIMPHALQELAKFLDAQITTADVRTNGTTRTVGLRRSIISGTVIRKHIYLTQQDPVGTIDRARLIGKDGQVWAQRTDQQLHAAGKGLLLEFRFTITEV